MLFMLCSVGDRVVSRAAFQNALHKVTTEEPPNALFVYPDMPFSAAETQWSMLLPEKKGW